MGSFDQSLASGLSHPSYCVTSGLKRKCSLYRNMIKQGRQEALLGIKLKVQSQQYKYKYVLILNTKMSVIK